METHVGGFLVDEVVSAFFVVVFLILAFFNVVVGRFLFIVVGRGVEETRVLGATALIGAVGSL